MQCTNIQITDKQRVFILSIRSFLVVMVDIHMRIPNGENPLPM